MKLQTFKSTMEALNQHNAACLLAGGMAVVAHGYGRMTFDIDLVIDLHPDNILRTFDALAELGYQPRVPITAEQFADDQQRLQWIREKGMTVLNFFSAEHRGTTIDVFAEEPFDFDEVYARSPTAEVDGVPFRYVDIETLIRMKTAAGRPVDMDDVRHLQVIANDQA